MEIDIEIGALANGLPEYSISDFDLNKRSSVKPPAKLEGVIQFS